MRRHEPKLLGYYDFKVKLDVKCSLQPRKNIKIKLTKYKHSFYLIKQYSPLIIIFSLISLVLFLLLQINKHNH